MAKTSIRLRMGRAGWEKWNSFTEEWDCLPYHIAMMNKGDLGQFYVGALIQWERLAQ